MSAHQGVLGFIIALYVENDERIYGEARRDIFNEYPELGDKEKLASNYPLKEQRDTIDRLCGTDYLTRLEAGYFITHPPRTSENGFYMALCGSVRLHLESAVLAHPEITESPERLVEGWKAAFRQAVDQPCPYNGRRGLDKLRYIYKIHESFLSDDKPIVLDFCKKLMQKELNFFEKTYLGES